MTVLPILESANLHFVPVVVEVWALDFFWWSILRVAIEVFKRCCQGRPTPKLRPCDHPNISDVM